MKQFEDIKKQMPYSESREYLDRLIELSTDNAILQTSRPSVIKTMWRPLVSAAAVVLLLLAVGLTQFRTSEEPVAVVQQEQQDKGPIDDFLNNLSDDEAQLLAYYDIVEVPEY